ncbi:MAG: iron-containing alcohol dehydrogenase [Acidobacteriota bacterium]
METPRPDVWSLSRLLAEDLGPTVVWASPSVRSRTQAALPFPHHDPGEGIGGDTQTLIAVGGGTLLDLAKRYRAESAPGLRLVAVASIWGSGAEASPIAVMNEEGRKVIRMGSAYLPDVRVPWTALADSVSREAAEAACGDAWSHALEGFLSPLADAAVQEELASVISEMLALPIGRDDRWFEASASACRLQSRASVGLVHGIAHTLEGPLRAVQPDFGWGHARLCSTFLWPVLSLDLSLSAGAASRLEASGLEVAAILDAARRVYLEEAYERAIPLLEVHWPAVLRDPSTRTNGALVRAPQIEHFRRRAFAA